MLEYAHKLTIEPAAMVEADVEALRAVGLSDTAIHDLAQVTALFAYYNRIADGLGIAIDDFQAAPGELATDDSPRSGDAPAE